MGLISNGHKVCGSTPGAVYVNVSHYLKWINKVGSTYIFGLNTLIKLDHSKKMTA